MAARRVFVAEVIVELAGMAAAIMELAARRVFVAEVIVELAGMAEEMMDLGEFVFVGIAMIGRIVERIEAGGVGDSGKFTGVENGDFADVVRCGLTRSET